MMINASSLSIRGTGEAPPRTEGICQLNFGDNDKPTNSLKWYVVYETIINPWFAMMNTRPTSRISIAVWFNLIISLIEKQTHPTPTV